MKSIIALAFSITGLMTTGCTSQKLSDKIVFASVAEAQKLLTQEDSFTDSWSPFDIDSRLQKPGSTKEELLDYISEQAREWTTDEQNTLTSIFKTIDSKVTEQNYNIDFPEQVYFVKTTAKEEGGAGGYTRGNYVVLKEDILTQPEEGLIHTVVHELFHVLSRSNPKLRKELYQIIGFQLMDPIEYPDKLKPYRITNPDAPQTDSYIKLTVDGKPVECMMVLHSKGDYTDGAFFKYLNVGFLKLTEGENKSVDLTDDQPTIYNFQEVSEFYEQVGRNTGYIIHPEEIMADNFVFAILGKEELTDPLIVDQIKGVLRSSN